ncbi:hypothetical protein K438DRAFT_1981693 [Mycena galopus ATCC 62051]|nr:hypothetical protein K438DRAFT_1981693 [Mycena galopus ATCC 62051]
MRNILDGISDEEDLPFRIIWATRKVTPPNKDDPAARNALPPSGLSLLTEASVCPSSLHPSVLFTPDLQTGTVSPSPPTSSSKTRLKKNSLVTVPLDFALVPFQQAKMLINDFAPDDWVGAWSSSAFDVAVRQRTSSGMVWDAWDKDKGYCQPCLTKFLDEHV